MKDSTSIPARARWAIRRAVALFALNLLIAAFGMFLSLSYLSYLGMTEPAREATAQLGRQLEFFAWASWLTLIFRSYVYRVDGLNWRRAGAFGLHVLCVLLATIASVDVRLNLFN